MRPFKTHTKAVETGDQLRLRSGPLCGLLDGGTRSVTGSEGWRADTRLFGGGGDEQGGKNDGDQRSM